MQRMTQAISQDPVFMEMAKQMQESMLAGGMGGLALNGGGVGALGVGGEEEEEEGAEEEDEEVEDAAASGGGRGGATANGRVGGGFPGMPAGPGGFPGFPGMMGGMGGFPGMEAMGGMGGMGALPGIDPGKYMEAMQRVMANPEFMQAAESLGRNLLQQVGIQ